MGFFSKWKRTETERHAPPETQGEDAQLMLQAGAGDRKAFEVLILRFQGTLLNFFRRLGAHSDEAEDAVQETFLRVHAYRERYKADAPFRTFLFTVARHAWLDLCRRRQRGERWGSASGAMETVECPRRMGADERMDLAEGLAELPEAQRSVLVMSLYGGLKYEEISEVLGIPVGTVKSRVFHALRKLRERQTRESTAR